MKTGEMDFSGYFTIILVRVHQLNAANNMEVSHAASIITSENRAIAQPSSSSNSIAPKTGNISG